ncbi:MAG: ABC transporter ATP-binding protein, partial [Planctomycetota bacterium]
MEETSSLYSALADAYTGIRVVKAYSTHSRERAKVAQSSRMMYRKSLRLEGYNALARSMTEMMGMTVVSLAILAGGYLVIRGKTDLLGLPMTNEPLQTGDILLFFGFLIGLSDPVRKLNEVWTELQRGVAAAHRIFEIVDHPVRVKNVDAGQQQIPARPHATLQFQDVQYHYSSGPAVLRGANLTIPHGETVAIVGPNGCGKSTLISLLCRFDDTRSGEISLDGIPLTLIPLRELRRRTALVSQQTVMFDGTIADNIRYGSPGAHDAAVRRAAELAFADEFIREKTENGYETLLGKGGVKLSGGQMQRIALARAILRDPDILILDEATSQIDLESEQLIHQALSKFLKGRTGIMITHRPTSLQLADRIVVMEQGEISDSGRHDQLMGKNAFYNSLCGIEDSDADFLAATSALWSCVECS